MTDYVRCEITIENDEHGTTIFYDTELDIDTLQLLLASAYNQVSEPHERIQVH